MTDDIQRQLIAAQRRVDKAKRAHDEAIADRDQLIREAAITGVTAYRIGKWIGLTQQAIRLAIAREKT